MTPAAAGFGSLSRNIEFFQQLINGLALGAIYALIALGYTMVYGVLRFINFAHGDVFMLGAFAGFFLTPFVNRFVPEQSYAGGIVVLLLAMAVCAVIGMVIEILAYRPLRSRPKLTVLITAIGVSLFIEYTCQHDKIFGAAPRKFPDLIPVTTWHVGQLVISSTQVIVFVTTLLLLAALRFIVQKTRVGTAMRAVSFNEQAAALMGVNINSIISFTFGLGSALAAAGGILLRDELRQHRSAHGGANGSESIRRRRLAASAICPVRRWAGCSWASSKHSLVAFRASRTIAMASPLPFSLAS